MRRSLTSAGRAAALALLLVPLARPALGRDGPSADEAFARGRYEEALEAYRRAPADDWRARLRIGDCLAALGRDLEAEEAYYDLMRDAPEDLNQGGRPLAGLFHGWWTLLDRRKDHEKAEKKLRALLEERPGHLPALQYLALAYHTQGLYEKALEAYARLAPRLPGTDWAYVNLGQVLERLGRYDEAAEAYLSALAVHPGRAETCGRLHQIGYRWAARRDADRARRLWEAMARTQGLTPAAKSRVHLNLGILLANHGEPERAGEHYRLALEHDARSTDALNNLGLLQWSRGNLAGAKASFSRALEIDVRYTNAYENIGNLERERGNEKRARVYFSRGLRHAVERLEASAAEFEAAREAEGASETLLRRLRRIVAADRYRVFRFRTCLAGE